MSFLRKILFIANIGAVLSILCSYLAPTVDPQNYWIFSFFGLMYPILFIINLLFVAYWIFTDAKYALISLLVLAYGYKNINSYFGFEGGKIAKDPNKISVISYNIGNALESYDKRKDVKLDKQEKLDTFLSRFKDEDIICLQEVGLYATDVIKRNFKNYNIHKFDKGTVIISKHKMIKKGQIEFGTKTNSCLWADLVIGIDTVRVYSLHLQSNKISKDANDMIANGSLKEEKTWKNLYGIFRKYNRHHKERTKQATTVKEHADLSPYKVILAGDFNDVPMSYNYNILQNGLQDAFKERGVGIGSTFNGKIPFLRIDYILLDNDFYVSKFNVIKENYSDHYPVAAVLSLRRV
jgi:endonuclease/exonuclease/phosphatase (EEP) superfamily protein YafD